MARADPGRISIVSIDDAEWPFYWHAFVGDLRVNGGLAKNRPGATGAAQIAIAAYRRQSWIETHIWDEETGSWYGK